MRRALALALLLACAGSSAQNYQFDVPRTMRCYAEPACGRPGYACKGVVKSYTGKAAGTAKDNIVQACVQANRPDRCGDCVQQCRKVARCSKVN